LIFNIRTLPVTSADIIRNVCPHFTRWNIRTSAFYPRLYLCQSVENCTRFREGHSPSKLDCIFTKQENQIGSLCYDAPLGKSDHCCLSFTFVLQSIESLAVPHMSHFNYWKGDYEAITQELDQIDWDSELNSKNTEEMWELIKNKLHEQCLKHVPLKVQGTKSKRKNSWLSRQH